MNGTSEARKFNNESITQSLTPAKFYRLSLPLDRIFVVDNSRSLRECMRTLCVVGLSMIYRKYYGYGGQELQNSLQFLEVSHSCDKISATYADIQHSYSLPRIRPLAPDAFFMGWGVSGLFLDSLSLLRLRKLKGGFPLSRDFYIRAHLN